MPIGIEYETAMCTKRFSGRAARCTRQRLQSKFCGEQRNKLRRRFEHEGMADLLGGEFPPSWRKVIYVLLAKPPPSNQALISERREIALMAQDMKLVMHMVRATAYRLITGRLRSEQCGWLPGYGTVDAGIPLAAVIQQAQRLRQSLWILYVDLATFFPRIDREALTVAEVLVGLPPPVIELVGKIYGAGRAVAAEAVECQFDTSIGLSASFKNHMGALMGEVLSPDRAKIILNSILWAIHLHVHGVQLFGFGEDEEGRIRAIASLAYADDWAGTFTSEADLKRAWAIWSVWVPISGSKLGIKQKLKTVVTGVLRDARGHESDIVDPGLVTLDGVRVPVLTRSEAYKHLGVLRVAMGGDVAAADSLKKQLRAAIGRVARMHKPSRRDMILVTNGLFQGLAGFKCSTVYYSFEWMEDVEKEIRVAGQMATWGDGDDGPRWLSFEEARRLYPWLNAKAATEWNKTVAALEERLEEVVAPEREAVRVWEQHAEGGRIFLDIDCEEEPRGGEASWLRRSDIDEQGFLAGWEERASMMRFLYVFDEMGFLCLRQGGRLESHQLGQLDPAVQITARARLALGDVETSHVGEPLNEWADVACDTFGLEDDYPIPRGIVEFASMTFPAHQSSAQEYVMQGMRQVVAARLRKRVFGTVLRDNTEHEHDGAL
eukprot:jgi/Chrpa1/15275/Chrysochromulina_OHIO_Genome00008315-RA